MPETISLFICPACGGTHSDLKIIPISGKLSGIPMTGEGVTCPTTKRIMSVRMPSAGEEPYSGGAYMNQSPMDSQEDHDHCP